MLHIKAIKPGKKLLAKKPFPATYDAVNQDMLIIQTGELLIAIERFMQPSGSFWSFLTQNGVLIKLREFYALEYLEEVKK